MMHAPQRATAPEGAAAVVPMQGANPSSETQPRSLVNDSPERSEVEARSAGAIRIRSGRSALLALVALAVLPTIPAPLASPSLGSGRGNAGKQRAKDSET